MSPAFQEAHFGRVVLRGESLAEYAFDYAGLTADETSEWDSFVAALEPEDPLVASIRAFRFSDESLDPAAEADEQAPSRAAGLIGVLSEAIEAGTL